ncbi:hypothetical protein BD414DRAFT_320257 [Trametes punicea]|nr:hypothetical protein BD414DRAFT_320257 [Trametes punicea]
MGTWCRRLAARPLVCSLAQAVRADLCHCHVGASTLGLFVRLRLPGTASGTIREHACETSGEAIGLPLCALYRHAVVTNNQLPRQLVPPSTSGSRAMILAQCMGHAPSSIQQLDRRS